LPCRFGQPVRGSWKWGCLVLIAELRHKLLDVQSIDPDAPDALSRVRQLLQETKEDLLTADVFGALKYLPRRPYLEAVFRMAAGRAPTSRLATDLPALLDELGRMRFEFWPTYPTPAGLDGSVTEPDVEFGGPDTLIFFEAKLHSGFGTLQVARELAVGLEQAGGRTFYLVLVTPHLSPRGFKAGGHRVDFESYVKFYAEKGDIAADLTQSLLAAVDRIVWISWADIIGALKEALQLPSQNHAAGSDMHARAVDLIGDLEELALMRSIRPYRGLGQLRAPGNLALLKRPILVEAALMGRYTFIGLNLQTMPRLRRARSLGAVRWRWRGATVADGPRLNQVVTKWRHRRRARWRFRSRALAGLEASIRRHRVDRLGQSTRLFHRGPKGIFGVVATRRVPAKLTWTFRGDRND
jgi:hypothetical protein